MTGLWISVSMWSGAMTMGIFPGDSTLKQPVPSDLDGDWEKDGVVISVSKVSTLPTVAGVRTLS